MISPAVVGNLRQRRVAIGSPSSSGDFDMLCCQIDPLEPELDMKTLGYQA